MIVQDQFGYDLTLGSKEALEPWNKTARAFIAHSAQTPVHLGAALEADPSFVMGQIAKGFFMLLLGRSELIETARTAHGIARAQADLGMITPRETSYLTALGEYLDGDMTGSAVTLDRALRAHPKDALALKLVHAIRFVLGDARGMRISIEGVLSAYDGDSFAPYVNGCYAFALEETGDFRAAEARGRDAVLRAKDDAWGVHAVAHVLDMTNRTQEGVTWLTGQPETWAHCNNFRYHVWWHLALFHLDRGEYDTVLGLYDAEVRNERSDDYRDIANAASLLSRLEFEGVDVGDRWEEMAEFCEARVDDGCVVFADLHYMLALTAADRETEAAALLTRMERDATRRIGDMGRVNGEAGTSTGAGLIAFAAGDYTEAYRHLSVSRPQLHKVGGSHAQRDVFTRVLIESAMRAGLLDEARAEIENRAKRRGAFDGYSERRLERIGAYKSLTAAAL